MQQNKAVQRKINPIGSREIFNAINPFKIYSFRFAKKLVFCDLKIYFSSHFKNFNFQQKFSLPLQYSSYEPNINLLSSFWSK